MINKSYAVFGLGRYGRAVALELVESGADVLAVDSDENKVNTAATLLPVCKCADITDAEVIKQLGISNIDVVIIAMAGDFESSVMATVLCKEAGVETVIVKCGSEMHRKILLNIGADKVVFPEKESGIRLAKNLLSSGFIDVIELSKGVSMVDLEVKEEWIGKTLIELDLRKKYSCNVVAISQNDTLRTSIDPAMPLEKNMHLVVVADNSMLSKISAK